MNYHSIQLKTGKEASVGFRHPWVFSGAIEKVSGDVQHGDLVYVVDRNEKIIGTGTYSKTSSIAVRVLEFKETKIDQKWFEQKIRSAFDRRKIIIQKDTTAFRVVFGESDGIPGLIIDKYEDVIVFQIATMGIDRMRDEIIEAIKTVFSPQVIVERSDVSVRKEEKLEVFSKVHFGKLDGPVSFKENSLSFVADVLEGQKTGFFLDQKDLRKWLIEHALRGSVLNLFSYSGGTGIAALKGLADSVHNVDGSVEALVLCNENAKLNKISKTKFTTEKFDVFDFLNTHQDARYSTVIMDPPALIKSNRDVEEGKKAYHFLNRAAMRLVEDGGIFITSSCSNFLSEEDMAFMLRRASVQAGIQLDILAVIRQSADHPLSVYFPEAWYLKSFIFRVHRL
ncbi:class I SAM-dependent rRNA methyltransferase [Candidatus Uhrbacteria bacterium]|nr:class I SAM-dependent rRNA methyltransferase [Candidatus Uhrbacteria bacterium]